MLPQNSNCAQQFQDAISALLHRLPLMTFSNIKNHKLDALLAAGVSCVLSTVFTVYAYRKNIIFSLEQRCELSYWKTETLEERKTSCR